MSHEEVQFIVNSAIREAILRRHEYITVEHILYAILQHEKGIDAIINCGGDVDVLLEELVNYFTTEVPELQYDLSSNESKINREGKDTNDKKGELTPVQTLGFQRVLERAMNQVVSSGKRNDDACE